MGDFTNNSLQNGGIPMLVYGSESWEAKKEGFQQLESSEMKVLKAVTGCTQLEHIRYETIKYKQRWMDHVQVSRKNTVRERECWKSECKMVKLNKHANVPTPGRIEEEEDNASKNNFILYSIWTFVELGIVGDMVSWLGER